VQPALTASAEGNNTQHRPVRRRRRLSLPFLFAGIAILAALAYLIYANTQANAQYYMTINELKGCSTCGIESVRVEGVVQAGSIVRDDQQQQVKFVITEGAQTLPVTYTGVVPDIFRNGAQVVVEGHYSSQSNFLQAQTLLTKCPSRFTSATPTS
jgi:cytochrome c-type biogenesis protein CcmE